MNFPFVNLVGECFLVVLLLSGIPLLFASFGGLCVSILQTATQIQEQSIGFIVKFLIVAATLVLFAQWFWMKLLLLLERSLGTISALGGLAL
jgi:flagellar biosynthetic protein FliQ